MWVATRSVAGSRYVRRRQRLQHRTERRGHLDRPPPYSGAHPDRLPPAKRRCRPPTPAVCSSLPFTVADPCLARSGVWTDGGGKGPARSSPQAPGAQ